MKYKLSELFDLQMGKTPARNNPEYWENGTNPWISISDMTSNGKYIIETKECITDKAVYETGIKAIFPGTVIMSFKLSVGKVAIVQTEENKVYSNEAIMAFEVKDDLPDNILIRNDYVYYLLSSLNFDNSGNKAVMGKTLNRGIISNTEVSLHNLEEQSEIVNVLDKVSELMDLRKKQLKKLDELVRARFVELFGDPVEDSMKWGQLPLSHFLKNIRYGTSTPPKFSENGFEFIRATNIKNGSVVCSDMKYIAAEEARKIEKCKVFGGEMIIVRSGVNAGDTCIIADKHCGQYAGYDMILVFNEKLHPTFANVLINTEYMDKVIKPLTRRAAQPHLNSEQVQSLPIIRVPYSQQKQFAAFVEQIDKSKSVVQKALDEAQLLFNSLMQKYFG